jgi:hypothetical protein
MKMYDNNDEYQYFKVLGGLPEAPIDQILNLDRQFRSGE